MTKKPSLIARLREGLTTTVTQDVQVVDCGTYGSFLASPEIDRFLQQRQLVELLTQTAADLSEFRITRPEAAKRMHEACDYLSTDAATERVPPSFDQSSMFPKTAVIRRIAQDFAGTGPIAAQLVKLAEIAKELNYGLGMFVVGATRAPDADSRRADQLAEAARAPFRHMG